MDISLTLRSSKRAFKIQVLGRNFTMGKNVHSSKNCKEVNLYMRSDLYTQE